MKLSISGAIENDRVLGQQIHQASQIVEKMGPTSRSVSAEWELTNDPAGRSEILLTLSDDTGVHVEARFSREELASEGRLLAKLYRIWGDLLQDRSHKLLEGLLGTAPAGK